MNGLEQYHLKEQLHASPSTLVFRATRLKDQIPVVLKLLAKAPPLPEESNRFFREFQILQSLQEQGESLSGIIKVYDFQPHHNSWVMELEDFGGKSLTECLKQQGVPDLREFLRIAIQITGILGQVHHCQIIHKDINPSNILWNPDTGQIKLIDFGIATRLSREAQTVLNPNTLEGTLAYISPEQTGRMNRTVDYRTDLYSLGITFYEMLTGERPFQSHDPMELVHCHIAVTPPTPLQLIPDFPREISSIVMKLLEKTAEERYQSAFGLKADLEACLKQYETMGRIDSLHLGHQDISEKFQIPQKLYGRDAQIEQLMRTFHVVSHGRSAMLLIDGFAGIGKSSLVNEVHKPIVRQRGYFISGKYDQFQRNTPYASLIQAFQEFVRQLLTESDEQLETWQNKLQTALEPNGQIIVDVIPEIEYILGKQEPVPPLPPLESQNRFNVVFHQFIRTLARQEHPLVLFMDDLQWADLASLQLLELLMRDDGTQYLLLIGAFRDNEVLPGHPLLISLKELETYGSTIEHIHLTPLVLEDVSQLIEETLHVERHHCQELARLIFHKTHGNPFFVNQFLQRLYEDQLIWFERQKQCWIWDLDRIEQAEITENVVELMASKLQKLLPMVQDALKNAACLGNSFDFQTLLMVCESTPPQLIHCLSTAIQEGLILPVDESYKLLHSLHGVDTKSPVLDEAKHGILLQHINPRYRFIHDRVQQAAYSLISDTQKAPYHLRIGRILLKNYPNPQQQEERIFDLVNQLNHGVLIFDSATEQWTIIHLNLTAGKKAKLSGAYESAFNYLYTAIQLIHEENWSTHYELCLELFTHAAEASFLSTRLEETETLIQTGLKHAKSMEDKIPIYEIRLQWLFARNQIGKAVTEGVGLLKRIGFGLPAKPNQLHLVAYLLRVKLNLWGRSDEDILSISDTGSAHALSVLRIMHHTAHSAYMAFPNLFPVAVFRSIMFASRMGYYPEIAFAFSAYGMILCGILGDMDEGYRIGQLAIKLNERPMTRRFHARSMFLVDGLIRHWKEPLRDTLGDLLKNYKIGLEIGDISFGTLSAHLYCGYSYFAGIPLKSVFEEMQTYGSQIRRHKQQTFHYYHSIFMQALSNLMEETQEPWLMEGTYYSESKLLEIHLTAHDETAIFVLFMHKMILNYLFGNFQQALENTLEIEKHINSLTGCVHIPLFRFYESLTLLRLSKTADKKTARSHLGKVKKNLKQLKLWSTHSPANYQHKLDLVLAEFHALHHHLDQAIQYHTQAIDGARKHQYLQEEALANELAGVFYLEQGQTQVARVYFIEAHRLYEQWNATAKVMQLRKMFLQHFGHPVNESKRADIGLTLTMQTDSSGTSEHILDLHTIFKATHSISEEIVLERLLKRLMQIVIESAGAQRGILLLEQEGHWLIEAESSITLNQINVLQSIPLEQEQTREFLPVSMIQFSVRTHTALVLDSAIQDLRFQNDPYVQRHQLQSALCLPVMHHGKISGILYLENNLMQGVFTRDRLELLKMLSAQIAVSIDNARLYSQMEDRVIQRTQDLQASLEQTMAKEREITHINQVLQTVNSTLDLDEVMKTAQIALNTVFAFNQIGLFLVNKERTHLQASRYFGYIHNDNLVEFYQLSIPLAGYTSFVSECFINNDPYYITPVTPELSEQFLPIDKKVYDMSPCKSYLLLPLHVQNKTIGVIVFSNRDEEFLLTDTDIMKADRYVNQIAAAINNAQLNQEIQQINASLEQKVMEQTHELRQALEKVQQASLKIEQNERMRHELATAKTVQQFLIPREDPVLDEIEIASYYKSASETGGDWYDFHHYAGDKRLDVLIGDVTGHGIPAAIITAMAASIYHSMEGHVKHAISTGLRSQMLHPSYLLQLLNQVLYSTTEGSFAMTFFYSVVDLEKKVLLYSSAGHNPCLLWRPSGFETEHKYPRKRRFTRDLFIRTPPLGYNRHPVYKIDIESLEKGDVLVWFTDGLIENTNEEGTMFGMKRLKHVLESSTDLSAHEIRDRIMKEANIFWKEHPAEDDVTLIVGKIY
ncbi:MAG: AAA family ATPase [SAR324 cluster bacterium]|nr:AAA family ATPase [SAR324 cluster bacterium]